MRIFKWSPTFNPNHESSIVPIWISLPELPAHLFQKDALFAIANHIGTPLQIADSTYNKSNLSKARVCVEIDLLKPTLEEIDIQICGVTIVQKIEYEQVPHYCSLCNHIGHQESECYSKDDNSVTIAENEITNAENNISTAENTTDENENVKGDVRGGWYGETVQPENENVENALTVGILTTRPTNFIGDLWREKKWISAENAVTLMQNLKRFGVVFEGIKVDVEEAIKRNRLAVSSAILFQKCVLLYDPVRQLYVKPLDTEEHLRQLGLPNWAGAAGSVWTRGRLLVGPCGVGHACTWAAASWTGLEHLRTGPLSFGLLELKG
ncbi:UNVERIFIED_CONTAM: hypothetical protein Sangu_1308500 [Sesamum angustifolium]|uniref:DUF4283 domain-containing protein n=1 Tax=Sesamum angustifolium TaxID=2727405 RepID=A0AAW2NP08_9LAMI